MSWCEVVVPCHHPRKVVLLRSTVTCYSPVQYCCCSHKVEEYIIDVVRPHFPPQDETPYTIETRGAPQQDLVSLRTHDSARDRAAQERVDQFDQFTPQASFPAAVDLLLRQYSAGQHCAVSDPSKLLLVVTSPWLIQQLRCFHPQRRRTSCNQ